MSQLSSNHLLRFINIYALLSALRTTLLYYILLPIAGLHVFLHDCVHLIFYFFYRINSNLLMSSFFQAMIENCDFTVITHFFYFKYYNLEQKSV